MNSMSAEAAGESAEPEGGPMWGRFFDSIGGQDDTESGISGSHIRTDTHSFQHKQSQLHQSPQSEVHPNDSASVVDDDEAESALAAYPKHKAAAVPSIMDATTSLPVDDGTYVFKFRTPSGRTHRFQARHDNVENLREIISGKLAADPFFVDYKSADESAPLPDPLDFVLSYTDADGDTVVITSDTDVTDAVKIARSARTDRVVLFIQGGKGWSEEAAKSEVKIAEVSPVAQQQEKEVDKTLPEAPPNYIPVPQDEILGMPKELLLPASIGVLALVIVGVFAISRLTRDNF